MSTIAYLRVSTDEQAESGLGLEAQMQSITKAFGAPYSVFRDEGYSGKDSNRPGLTDALEALHSGDVLAVAKRDRLARDTFLSLWLEKEVKKRGARIVSAAGEGTDSDEPTAVLMRTLVDAFATYERQLIGQRTKAALAQKKARGEHTGGNIPFGYDIAADGVHLVTNQEEQEVLRMIARMKDRGYPLRRICEKLESRGVQTKRGRTTWDPKTLSRIIERAK
jgi:DNA invertase Pin-like site-specific DNA recombinase